MHQQPPPPFTPPPFTGPDLCALSATEVVALLRRGAVSPAEVLQAALARIDQVEPEINAMVTPCPDRARKALADLPVHAARNGKHPGWLGGLPIGVKDLTPVAGVRTTMGSRAFEHFIPDATDPLIARLEARGAIVAGKTNTPEFGAGGNTQNAVFGATRNPWDTARNAGGSSGGAAASLASGEVWLSHGSDLAGSLRTPAAYCGVIGLRPSPGRVGGAPEAHGFNTEAVQGPMARNIADCALFMDALCGFDPIWPLSIEAPATPFQTAVAQAGARVRIAFAPDLGGFGYVDPVIRAALAQAMHSVERAGGSIEETCPELPDLERIYLTLRAMFWAALPGRAPGEVQAHYKPTLHQNIEHGRRLGADAIYDAQLGRSRLYNAMRALLERFDVLAFPTMGVPAGPVEQEFPPVIDGKPVTDYVDWLKFSFLSVATGLPALSMPAGFTPDGMPVGLQLIGPPRGEARLLAVARAIEDALGGPLAPIDPRRRETDTAGNRVPVTRPATAPAGRS
ncbi:MAG: amidase [Pararhodobacter sp.]